MKLRCAGHYQDGGVGIDDEVLNRACHGVDGGLKVPPWGEAQPALPCTALAGESAQLPVETVWGGQEVKAEDSSAKEV